MSFVSGCTLCRQHKVHVRMVVVLLWRIVLQSKRASWAVFLSKICSGLLAKGGWVVFGRARVRACGCVRSTYSRRGVGACGCQIPSVDTDGIAGGEVRVRSVFEHRTLACERPCCSTSRLDALLAQKFIASGLFFKFARDVHNIFGGDEFAMKSASLEAANLRQCVGCDGTACAATCVRGGQVTPSPTVCRVCTCSQVPTAAPPVAARANRHRAQLQRFVRGGCSGHCVCPRGNGHRALTPGVQASASCARRCYRCHLDLLCTGLKTRYVLQMSAVACGMGV